MSQKLSVTARNAGHYGDRHRRPGETFELSAKSDLAPWMKPVGWDVEAAGALEQPAVGVIPEPEHKAALSRIADLEQALVIVQEERDAADAAGEATKARIAELEAQLAAATAPKAEEKAPAPPVQQPKAAAKTDKT
ncbi:hypothetical protein Sp245p_16350 (plasmid) [Azospirillum baldaniorum]|uniref:Uncharacterized protein n=1 Tax=Azospirillum baldaniorum TaxID=1064539 RepID=A0A9P1JU33_9PROT|nr:hypothetical protein [Azospirillum baldaniorum]AWJ91416.1 hypothetical protein Sp245p_16350 [Azospirillum baldaniorum]TWA83728.1 hypothetical protein FBZ85_101477 [Azospirillum brasilense]CCC99705.1 protein of unknown function [Azospirillum baldaniorum]